MVYNFITARYCNFFPRRILRDSIQAYKDLLSLKPRRASASALPHFQAVAHPRPRYSVSWIHARFLPPSCTPSCTTALLLYSLLYSLLHYRPPALPPVLTLHFLPAALPPSLPPALSSLLPVLTSSFISSFLSVLPSSFSLVPRPNVRPKEVEAMKSSLHTKVDGSSTLPCHTHESHLTTCDVDASLIRRH